MSDSTGTIHDQMAAAVRRVAEARAAAVQHAADLAVAHGAWEIENARLIAADAAAKMLVREAEATAKALAEAHFLVTGEKKPVLGIEVKERTTRTINDPAAALAWARQAGVGLLPERVDEKALLKVAAATPLPFVTTATEPMVTLASDLSSLLASNLDNSEPLA